MQPCKKRRLDDNNHQLPSYAGLFEFASLGANHPHPISHSASNAPQGIHADRGFGHDAQSHPSPLATRKIIPLPSAKRQRTTADVDVEGEGEPMQRSPSSSPSQKNQREHHRHHPKDESRDALHDRSQVTSPTVTTTTTTNHTSTSLMNRCHICFRKPNKKSDLDSFADCQGCGQRTCYVCIRECLGWGLPNLPPQILDNKHLPTPVPKGETSFTMLDADATTSQNQPPILPPEPKGHQHEPGWAKGGGHRPMVCSRCCVEKGQDGDVVCLGCLLFVEG